MSDAPQGEGWWQASDLKWYPPASSTPSRRRWVLPAVLLVVVAMVAAGTVVLVTGGDEAGAAVLLEPVDEEGPDPFTRSVAITEVAEFPDTVQAVITETTEELPPDSSTGTLVALGDTPGLYGGTGDEATCDVGGLNQFLTDPANAEKAAAWASAVGTDVAGITALLESLTSTVLTVDTRVTNNGYSAGRATPRQSVLQAGTALMVDDLGVPRVKCGCGNPLSEPDGIDLAAAPTSGPGWTGYEPARVATPAPAPDTLEQVTLVDVDDGELFDRPVGSAVGSLWVAVAGDDETGGSVHVSTDGDTWELAATTPALLTGVAQGDGRFVAVGSGDGGSGVALTSDDGVNWSEPVEVSDQRLTDVVHGNDRWLAMASDRAYTSDDGTTWSEQPPIRFDFEDDQVGSLTFGDGVFTIVTTSCGASRCFPYDLMTSPDGASWTRSPVTVPLENTNGAPEMADNGGLGAVGARWDDQPPGQPSSEQTTSPYVATLGGDDEWTVETPEPADLRLDSLGVHAGSWIAVGAEGRSTDADRSVYESSDLRTWRPLATIDAPLTDVVVGRVAGAASPTPSTTTTEPDDVDILMRTETIEVAGETFPNGGAVDALMQQLQQTLGDPTESTTFDGELCGSRSTVVSWGAFRLTWYGTDEAAATGFRASLIDVDPRVATVDDITVGTALTEVLEAQPGAPTSDIIAPTTRILLDGVGTGAGVVVQGERDVEEIHAPYALEQLDDC
jgi:hypothetical protein